jgi:hypothetical protein
MPAAPKDVNSGLIDTQPAMDAVSITANSTTSVQCRAVWIGTTQGIDLYVNGAWVTFQGAQAGTIIPIHATGARKTAAGASPSSGDIVFLY